MSNRHQLRKLLQTSGIWRAAEVSERRRAVLPTGFAELDRALSGGWPVGRLIELLSEQGGIGEFRLLMPALHALDGERQILLVAPPYIPYAPALMYHGLDVSRLLIVHCRRPADVLWAVEQALRSGVCAAVLAWVGAGDGRLLRRVQLAAENSHCWFVLFRPLRFRQQPSPAALRITLKPDTRADLCLQILKYRGGRPQTLHISLGADE